MMRLKIGTRRSPLALWQARHVAQALEARGAKVELVEVLTQGDRHLDSPLATLGGKGLFVKELEERLLADSIDLAVHSLKDLPGELPEGLVLAAVAGREDPRDALISNHGAELSSLPRGARIGTSSLRRKGQLLALRPDLQLVPIRGNIQTRIAKIRGELDGGVLAMAGLVRLGLGAEIASPFTVDELLPAVGQGALAVECRAADLEKPLGALLLSLEGREAGLTARCERAFQQRIGGGCHVPIAAHCRLDGEEGLITALVCAVDGSNMIRRELRAPLRTPAEAEALGARAGELLLSLGARELLTRTEVDE